MNPTKNETDAIRSDIDVTRRRMDDTMDALGDRLQPRHLLDEFLGYLRGNTAEGENRLDRMREKITSSCNSAVHSVADSVKNNPMPAILIGAGVAWMIYASRRDRSDYDSDYRRDDERYRYDPDTHYDRQLEYPSPLETAEDWSEEGKSKLGEIKDKVADKVSSAGEKVKEKLSDAGDTVREKAGQLRERANEKLQAVKERASEVTAQVRDSTREAYVRTRERVVTTADQHPLEVGLAALAAGLIVGLALPTPNAVNRRVGPAADRLRDRTREAGSELLEKGKRVAEAAVSAVKEEAQAQGLTPERLRSKATAVADRATEAGKEAAKREGLTAGNQSGSSTPAPTMANTPSATTGQTCPPGSDPSVARPAV